MPAIIKQPIPTQMKVAVAIAACMGIIIAPLISKADSLYGACGAQAVGMIMVGGKKTCLLENETKAKTIPRASSAPREPSAPRKPAVTAGANKDVDDSLNTVDSYFRDGNKKTGCDFVGVAISEANRYSDTSEDQKQQVRSYAQQCNLRY